ncbi:MAG: tetratricopeptide repeat protein [Bacteroidetes bacterium]|nr:tetratricopeptide repeat protein [Bacteroidota bacterium]
MVFIFSSSKGVPQYDTDSLLRELNTSDQKSTILNLLAEATLEDSLELSMAYATRALTEARIEKNIREEGLALFGKAEVKTYEFKLDSAVYFYEKALDLLKASGDDYNTSYCLNNLGWIHNYYGEHREAIEKYNESLAYLDKEKHQDELPNIYINIGNAYHHMGSYHTAIDYFHKAILIIDKIEDKQALPIAYNGLGLAWKYLGNFDSAILYYDKMLEIDKQTSSVFDKAIDYGNIGALYFDWGQIEQSRKFHQLSLDIYLQEGDKNNISVAYNNLGEVYHKLDKPDSALYFLNKALEIDRKTGMEHNMAMRFNNIGDVYTDLRQYEKALDYYHLALEINRAFDDRFNIALNLKNIAHLKVLTNHYQQAENLYNKSLKMAKELESKSLLAGILESMALFYSETGRFEKAFQYHLQLDVLEDSIFKIKNQQLLADLQTQHHLDQKEKEIAILNSENKRNAEEARQYRNSTIFFGSALLIITSLLILMIYQFRLRKNAYKKLVQKNMQLAETINQKPKSPTNGNVTLVPVQVKNGNGNGNHTKLYDKLKICLETEKPFLLPDLTMKELAQQLQTNSHYLSEVINQRFGTTFTGLINEYRVREACRMLGDEKKDHLTIESIASEAGFNSKSAFNNAFKLITGLTPSYYKKSARAQK